MSALVPRKLDLLLNASVTVLWFVRPPPGASTVIETYLREDRTALVVIQTSRGLRREIYVRLVPPSQIERSTGTLRSPELTIDLPAELVAQLVDAKIPAAAELVIGLLVHTVSRRTTAVGVFATAESAMNWWAQPYNRLAHNTDVLFLLVPVINEVDGDPL
jgi:hypothetical protein